MLYRSCPTLSNPKFYKLFEFNIIFAIFIQPKLDQTFDRRIILLQIHMQ